MVGRSGKILIIATVLTCGCNNQRAIRRVADSLVAQPDPTIDLLESELRWMEDNLYHLDAQLETCLRQLESTKRTNAALRLELAEKEQRSAQGSTTSTPSRQAPKPSDENRKYDEELESDGEELFDFTPKIELGVSQSNSDDATEGEEGSGVDNTEVLELPRGAMPAPRSESPRSPQGDPPVVEPSDNPFLDDEESPDEESLDEEVAPDSETRFDPESGHVIRIQLNDRLTGGYNSDRRVGHDGVMVVIEPMDAWAHYVPQAAAVTIELRDPSQAGVVGLVGKWSFTAAEIASKMKKSLLGEGIHLELPWPNGSPTARNLMLEVRYHAASGKTLLASREIMIEPTTSALVTQAEIAEQGSWYRDRSRTATRWQSTR